jgi:tRNA nucleotidyltransferase/poly(A) polymerase
MRGIMKNIFKISQTVHKFVPTSKEKEIFDFLLKINKKYNLGLTFRAVGGVVRDRLLGKESDDLDISIDKMTGGELGKYIQKETGKSGNIIESNPEQSKHLETLTVNLFGQDVDFVNLRNESYGDSRIPEMSFGTPEDDALRRDLTLNSLFYNINEDKIEDFTGKGLKDLGIDGGPINLDTPLDPVKTFTDDPLRILRILRFYSRYQNSKIDPKVIEAMKLPNVQKALKEKVSAERVLTEFNKLFQGAQPEKALKILHDTGIWNIVAGDQLKGFNSFDMDQNNKHHIDNVLEHTLKVVKNYNEILQADNVGNEERAKLLMAAFFHDLGKLDPAIKGIKEVEGKLYNNYHGHEDVSASVAKKILEALKASNEDIQLISTVCQEHMKPHDEMSDKMLRRMVRELGRNLLIRIVQHAKADATSKPDADINHYDNLLNRAKSIEQLENKKPVLSGNIIMNMFPNIPAKTGFIKYINNKLQDIQDEFPNTTQDEYIQKVEAMRSEIENMFGIKKANNWFQLIH